MPRRAKVKGHIQMEPGKWYRLSTPEVTECCDCGLVHHTEYMFKGTNLFWRASIDKRATAAARKAHGITVIKNEKTKLP